MLDELFYGDSLLEWDDGETAMDIDGGGRRQWKGVGKLVVLMMGSVV